MTCQEFKRLFNETSPLDCTRAERAAHIHHGKVCPQCHAWFLGKCEGILSAVTPIQIRESMARVFPVIDADKEDPEVRLR